MTNPDLIDLIRMLGFVQVDSINTVTRAHHMILFSRNQNYRPTQLKHLLETERTLFEHWTHDASIIPVEYFPYWRHRFERDRELLISKWRKSRHEGFEEIFDEILSWVAENGPTMAREIGSKRKTGRGWWDWHPEKTALEFHWRTGTLSITRREGFQKVYDLTCRVIPEHSRDVFVSKSEFIEWACNSALNKLGLASPKEILEFWNLLNIEEIRDWCHTGIARGKLIEVEVEGVNRSRISKTYAKLSDIETFGNLPKPSKQLRILSPFDPLIRDRRRCLRLFGFDYRIEVFVPRNRRQYGYYVFPIMESDRFIGRIDLSKKSSELIVNGLWTEAGVKMGKGRMAALELELDRYRRFIGAERVEFNCKLSF